MQAIKNNNKNNQDFVKKSNSELVSKFIKSVSVRNINTGKQYQLRISLFEKFLEIEHSTNTNKLIQQLKDKKLD